MLLNHRTMGCGGSTPVSSAAVLSAPASGAVVPEVPIPAELAPTSKVRAKTQNSEGFDVEFDSHLLRMVLRWVLFF